MAGFMPEYRPQRDKYAITAVIPITAVVLSMDSFSPQWGVNIIAFQPGSQLRSLGPGTFGHCKSLKSICFPASLELIEGCCFIDQRDPHPFSPVESVTFAPMSKLKEIREYAFAGCECLKSICLPRFVSRVKGESFARSGISRIDLEPGNRFFHISGEFLTDNVNRRIVRYFGTSPIVLIPRSIEVFGSFCFGRCSSLLGIKYESIPLLSLIETRAFMECSRLSEIAIPSTVTFLAVNCFERCIGLQKVTFPWDSQITTLPEAAFKSCERLQSIAVPASVSVIGVSCFADCFSLAAIYFAPDAKLVRIDRLAFSGCDRLTALNLTSAIEHIGSSCFNGCFALKQFTFSGAGRLRELLDLPPEWPGVHWIPDSVEILSFVHLMRASRHFALLFGRESRLAQVMTYRGTEAPPSRAFVHLSARSLKLRGPRLEFTGN
jgi:hypothetical protein